VKTCLALVVLAACAQPGVRYPEAVRHVTGGWIDTSGLFHIEKTPIVMQLPSDVEIERVRRKSKTVLLARMDDEAYLMLYWWPMERPDADTLENTMVGFGEVFEIEAQLQAAPIKVIEMTGAVFARHKRWVEDDIAIEMRTGCEKKWCVAAITYVGATREFGAALDVAIATLGFLD
jgi:hypothetical protein